VTALTTEDDQIAGEKQHFYLMTMRLSLRRHRNLLALPLLIFLAACGTGEADIVSASCQSSAAVGLALVAQ